MSRIHIYQRATASDQENLTQRLILKMAAHQGGNDGLGLHGVNHRKY